MTQRSLLVLLLIGILLAACAPSGPGQPTPDIDATIAANAETMVAMIFLTQTALAPSATNTALPTMTSLPTSTPLALSTSAVTVVVQQPVFVAASPTATGPTSTPLASSLAVGCNNLRLISSYTVPDSPLVPNQDFTQFWQVENTGTCDWMFVYAVQYASGQKFGEATSVRFGNKIEPKKWTTISVNMHAPDQSGTYKASWRLTDGNTAFGAVLPVNVTVGGPTKTPKPPAATPNLQQTADAANTALAAQQTAVAQQATAAAAALTAQSVNQTATACAATQAANGTCQ